MRFLGGLGSLSVPFGGAGAERKDAHTMERASAGPFWSWKGQPYKIGWSVQRAVRDAYDRSIWVYRGTDALATNEVGLQFQVQTSPLDPEKTTEDPLLTLLNVRANEFETAEMFRYRLVTQFVLSKAGVFIEVVRGKGGEPVGLYLLPPQYTFPLPDPNKFVAGYRVELPNGEVQTLAPEQVVWLRKPHPLDPYSGVTALESAGISIDLDVYAQLYNRTFMQNDGRPGGIIGVKGRMLPEDALEMKRRVGGGGLGGAGRTSVIETDSVSFVDTSVNPRDAQYVEGRSVSKSDILLALGVPLSVIGDASGRTFDNADAEWEIFWRSTMKPILDFIAGAFQSLLAAGNAKYQLAYDLSKIAVLQRDQQARVDKALTMYQAGLLTVDEMRDLLGFPKLDVPASRTLWVPAGKFPVARDEADQEQVTKITTMPAGTSPALMQMAAQGQPYGGGQQTLDGSGGGQQQQLGTGAGNNSDAPLGANGDPTYQTLGLEPDGLAVKYRALSGGEALQIGAVTSATGKGWLDAPPELKDGQMLAVLRGNPFVVEGEFWRLRVMDTADQTVFLAPAA